MKHTARNVAQSRTISREDEHDPREAYEPYTELLVAIIYQAMHDIMYTGPIATEQRWGVRAYYWLMDDDPKLLKQPFSFLWICSAVSIRAKPIREQIRKLHRAHLKRII